MTVILSPARPYMGPKVCLISILENMSISARPTVSRRVFVQGSVLTIAGATVMGLSSCSASSSKNQPEPQGYDSEPRALPIPPVEEGEVIDGTRVIKLTAQDGYSEVLPGNDRTRTWGFNGPFLGPTLRARRGEKVRAEITNNLIEMTTVHWHGMKLPAYSDGGPHSPIEVGKTWKPEWEITQPHGHAVVPPAPAHGHGHACLPRAGGHVPHRR